MWGYACKPGLKMDTMAALGRSKQHHYHFIVGAVIIIIFDFIFNIVVGFIFSNLSGRGVRGGLN